ALALHARTAEQRYSGHSDWSQIARLKEHVTDIPVLGNGDIFTAQDASRMMAETGCDGVVIGRGCQGRPWLFAELDAHLGGRGMPVPPPLGEVARIMHRHLELLIEHHGEMKGCREIRKHISWYLHGFPAGSELRVGLARVTSMAEFEDLLGRLDPSVPFPDDGYTPRGRQGSPGKVVLPEGWLEDPDDPSVPFGADMMNSGG